MEEDFDYEDFVLNGDWYIDTQAEDYKEGGTDG